MELAKKGQRVQITDSTDTLLYGVVEKGGSNRIKMVLDGGKQQIACHVSMFELSDKPLPVDKPNPMNKYSIKGYKEIQGHGDSRTFHATIYKDGKPILTVENNGWGGCNDYNRMNINQNLDIESSFHNSAVLTMQKFGDKKPFEASDSWVEWYQHKKPFGVTFEEDTKESIEAMAKYNPSKRVGA